MAGQFRQHLMLFTDTRREKENIAKGKEGEKCVQQGAVPLRILHSQLFETTSVEVKNKKLLAIM